MAEVPLRQRLVEVIADLDTGGQRYGSGCIVAGGTVLTAAHVVAGAQRVRVRGPDKRLLACAQPDPACIGHPSDIASGPDLALLEITDPEVDLPAIGLARVDRDSSEGEVVDRCHAWGYPQFAEVHDPGNRSRTVRETRGVSGVVPVGSGLVYGLLDVQATVAPRDLPPEQESLGQSQWSGMSGGPVTSRGLLLGVVAEHAPRAGPGSITATPLTAISRDPANPGWGHGVCDPAMWWARLRVDGPEGLMVLPAPATRPQPGYHATLHEIGRDLHLRMPRLVGRDQELADIAAFATSTEGYRWLVGGAWTGKSALMYTAVTAGLPDNVDVISYFLRRVVSDADSSRFLEAVVPQLAYLCDQDTPAVLGPGEFRTLWQEAASKAAEGDRHVLLVVDGLDEDLGTGAYGSVASLLPTLAGGRAHVHVTSRLHPELPHDVTAIAGHPLSATTPVELAGFPGFEHQAALARDQLADVLDRRSGDLAFNTLGLLTAAAGPLTSNDLAILTAASGPASPAHRQNIADLLTGDGDLARVVQPTGSPDQPRYTFAHGSLLEQAQVHPNLSDDYYRQQLHNWCDTWRDAGWPDPGPDGTCTPRYLLDTYPTTLATVDGNDRDREQQRLTTLVGDIGWIATAIRTIGVDPVLASLERARAIKPASRMVTQIAATVAAQALNMRGPHPARRRGDVLRQLCFQAMEFADDDLARSIRALLRDLPDPGPVPIWTIASDQAPMHELGSHSGGVYAAAVLSTGQVVTAGTDGTLRVWDLAHPNTVVELGDRSVPVTAIAALPDEKFATGREDGAIQLWDLTDPSPPVTIGHHSGPVWAVASLGNDKIVAGGRDGHLLLWDLHSEERPQEIGRHVFSVGAVAVLDDGRVVTGGVDANYHGRVLVWDPERPSKPTWLGEHFREARAVAVFRDGRVASGGEDGRVRVWNPDEPGLAEELGQHATAAVTAIAVVDDHRVVSGSDDGQLLVWDPELHSAPEELGRHATAPVTTIAVMDNNRIVTGGDDGRVRVWALDQRRDPGAPRPHGEDFSAIAVLGDGRVVTGAADGSVSLWDPATPTDPRQLGKCAGAIRSMLVLADGLVTGDEDGQVLRWDPAKQDQTTVLVDHEWPIVAIAALRDGRIATGDERDAGAQVLVWNPNQPGPPLPLDSYDVQVWGLAALPNGWVATCGLDEDLARVRVCNPEDRRRTRRIRSFESWGTPSALAVLDDRIVLVTDSGEILICATTKPAHVELLGRHEAGEVSVMALGRDQVITAGTDSWVVRIWDQRTPGQPVCEIDGGGEQLDVRPASTADHYWLVVASRGSFTVWTVPAPKP